MLLEEGIFLAADLSKVSFHIGVYKRCTDVNGKEVSVCTSTRRDCADTDRELYDEELCGNFVTAVCRVSFLHEEGSKKSSMIVGDNRQKMRWQHSL